jgi:hypothetical protein
MPKINTIAIVPVPKLSDKLVGTSVGGTPVNQTNNFTLQQLKTLFDGAPVSPNLQAVLNAGNTATQNIYLTGTIDTVNLDVSNDSFLKNLYLSERLFDRNNFQGTSGQYLTSTGTGVQWSTLTIATPTLQQVLTAGNISDKNIITTGNIQAANIEGTNITANTNLRVVGTLSDSSNSVGGSGQVLSSTVTGTDWIDFPSYSAVSPLIYNNVLKQFSIQVATSTQNGYLSSADWITFNGKQNAGNYITALTGEASALGPGSVNITLNNLAVINKTLTGLAISSGVITAADSIITAFGKIQGQINGIVAGVVYQGVWNAATNTPTLTSSVGVQGHYYVVDVAGNTNLNGITDWQVGDWAIYNGTAWQKVDNTDSVTSVNGQTGIVVLNSDNIAEGTTNLYYLDSRARAAISSVATGLTYTSATGVFSLTAGYSIPTVANQTNWTTAYNDSIVSAAVTGTTTKTLTLTQQDGGTITASWTDIDTNLVTSVFGRTGAVVAQSGDYSTTLVTEGTNLYYLDSRARSAISSSATGLTYTTATGVFSFTAGYSIPTDASQSNWTTAYNDSITSAAVTGTTTKTLTLNQQDGGTITASWTDLDTGLTSVGVSMPSAFNVTNSPLTSNGTIAVTGAGTASQYVRGDGTLGDFPTGGGGGGASVSYYLNGSINQGTFGGNTYYQMSKTPILGAGTDFTINANGYIAQFITDVGTPDALLIPGGNWNFETYFSASSGGGSPTFYIELYKYDGATFTLIASNSSNPELIAFGTTINPYYNSLAVPETILLATDRLAIRIYVFTSGRTITLHTEDNHLCQAITTFTTGLTALNGLTKQIQYFSVGTSGTDFNISSSVATHTFNLPTASAVNRGALSAADWSTFNAKQNALTLTTTGTSGSSTFISNVLNVPTYTLSGLGGVPTSRQLTINGTAYDLSADRSWSVGTVTSVGLSSATSGVTIGSTPVTGSGTITLAIATATATQNGLLSSTDWSTFNSKQNTITLTTTGNSGSSTLIGSTLNIPTYTLSGLGGVPTSRTITINGTTQDLSADRTYSVGTVTSVSALTLGTSGTDLSSSVANGTTTPVITLNVPTASATNRGALSAADWTTFNSKQNAITLTTTGTSGAATLVGSTLNIPQYQSVLTNPITGTGTTNYLPKFTGSTTIGNSILFDNGTNIGIGTASPNRKLEVITGNGTTNGIRLTYAQGVTAEGMDITYLNTGDTTTSFDSIYNSNSAVMQFRMKTGGTPVTAMTILGSGNVGIGYSSPTYQLQVLNTIGLRANSTSYQAIKGTYWGYSTSYPVVMLGDSNTANFTTVSIGYDPSANSNGAFSGDGREILFRRGAQFVTPNAANTAFNLTNLVLLDGNVGIGTSSPTNGLLVINSTAANGVRFALESSGTMNGIVALGSNAISGLSTLDMALWTRGIMAFETGASGEKMRLTSGGNLLVGTTTDAGFKLDVNGTGRFIASSSTNLVVQRTGSNGVFMQLLDASGNSVFLGANNGDFLVQTPSGGFSNKLTIANSGAATFSSSVTATGGLISNGGSIGYGGGELGFNVTTSGATSGIYTTATGSPILYFDHRATGNTGFWVWRSGTGGGTTALTLSNVGAATFSGRVGVAGAAATYPITVYNASNGTTAAFGGTARGIRIDNDGTFSSGRSTIYGVDSSFYGSYQPLSIEASSLALQAVSGGNVLIGTTTDAGYTLNVAGNAQFIKSSTSTAMVVGLSGVTGSIIRFSYNGGFVGSISTDGSNTAYNTSSDYRLKEQIRAIDNPLEKVLKLNPVNFKYKNSKTVQDGFIAHEIQEILPYLVTGEKDGAEMQEVDYSKLTPILIAAIKELKQEIDKLRNK